MKNFNDLWQFIIDRSNRDVKPVVRVQDKTELEHIFNLMRDCECKSYLEIGTAEGNSLYVLSEACSGKISYIDLGEPHTTLPRNESIEQISNPDRVVHYIGDSTTSQMVGLLTNQHHECVLIDGGHDFSTVLSDAINYGPLATKYIFFHDIQLPEVRRAVSWWHSRWQLGKYSEFINSDSFGYAIIEVGK